MQFVKSLIFSPLATAKKSGTNFVSLLQTKRHKWHFKFFRPRINNSPRLLIPVIPNPKPNYKDTPLTTLELADGSSFQLQHPVPEGRAKKLYAQIPPERIKFMNGDHITEEDKKEIKRLRYTNPFNYTSRRLSLMFNCPELVIAQTAPMSKRESWLQMTNTPKDPEIENKYQMLMTLNQKKVPEKTLKRREERREFIKNAYRNTGDRLSHVC